MGFFGLFKKKDDFDSILKDPLTDPLGGMPGQSPFGEQPSDPLGANPYNSQSSNPYGGSQSQSPFGSQSSQDLSSFDTPGMPKSEAGLDYSSSLNANNYETSAKAFPQQQGQSFESTYPQRRNSIPGIPEPPMQQQQMMPQRVESAPLDKRDIELINSKLDTIRSQLESLSQRLVSLEKKPYEEELPRPRRYNW